ncbi:MAG: hypothetical protein GF353_03660 [Candidatus Lokiarchaeota archaeon]|nr:hypothetical protein [Candidatus Lokiarchaeota archaeon]
MKKKKTIIITNPFLQNARNFLRKIIEISVIERKREIRQEQKLVKSGRSIKELSSKELEQYRALQKTEENWKTLLVSSLCQCPACNKTESNMTYNTYDGRWYCKECYDGNKEFHAKRGKSYYFP